MTTLAINSCIRDVQSRHVRATRWPAVVAFGVIWYGAFALMLLGQALGLL
jgi:hypothetical protein